MNTRVRCQQNGHNYIQGVLSVNHLGLDKNKKTLRAATLAAQFEIRDQ